MNIEKRVIELVNEKIADREDLFLVSVSMSPNGRLSILLDGDQGIAIEDCAAVSRHVGYHLEEENVIDSAYNLEVSSPGVGVPLVLERQYLKNIGRNISVKELSGDKHEGKLLSLHQGVLTLEETVKEKGKKAAVIERQIPLDTVKETKVLISFK